MDFIARVSEFDPPCRLATENRKLVIQSEAKTKQAIQVKRRHFILSALPLMPLLTLLTSCSYTAPFRRVETPVKGSTVLVTLTAVEHKPGQRGAFFTDTKNVLADLPNHAGLIGYSFRFQILGKKAWTMTAWKDEESRDRFVASPIHRKAVRNSRFTSQNMRFITVSLPEASLPMKWSEARRHLENAPGYE